MFVAINNYDPLVVLIEDDGDLKSPCNWVSCCPAPFDQELKPYGLCSFCPARKADELLTHEDGVKWWEEAKMFDTPIISQNEVEWIHIRLSQEIKEVE